MYSKILIPLDGSKTAEKGLPYARYLAGQFKIPVELLAVIDIAEMAAHMAAEKARFLDTMVEDATRSSETYLRNVTATFAGANVKHTVVKGRAEDAIIEKGEADKNALITMATHGVRGSTFLARTSQKSFARSTIRCVGSSTEAAKQRGGGLKAIIGLGRLGVAEACLRCRDGAKSWARVTLFRTFHILTTLRGAEVFTPSLDELTGLCAMKPTIPGEKARGQSSCRKSSCLTKEFAARDNQPGQQDSRRFDRHVFPWPFGRQALGARQRDGDRGAPFKRSSTD